MMFNLPVYILVLCTAYTASFEECGKDFQFMVWCHDELQIACRNKEIAEDVLRIAQNSMRESQSYFGFRVQLDVDGKIGRNWADCH